MFGHYPRIFPAEAGEFFHRGVGLAISGSDFFRRRKQHKHKETFSKHENTGNPGEGGEEEIQEDMKTHGLLIFVSFLVASFWDP